MTENQKKTIRDNILSAIETGKVTMKPKWHFVVRGMLVVVGMVLLILTLLYLASFILFLLAQSGVWFVPGFGLRGLYAFLASVPWALVVLVLVFIILLQVLIRKYSFSYGRPLLFTALGIIGLVAVGGIMLSQTGMHTSLFQQSLARRLPFAGKLYREYGMPRMSRVASGMVTAVSESGCELQNPRSEIFRVIHTPQTEFYPGTNVEVGDEIVVMGQRRDGYIEAAGVRELYSGKMLRRHQSGFGPRRMPMVPHVLE